MLFFSPLRRAVAAFFLLLFFAVVASAVCVAFGAGANPLLAPGAAAVGPQAEATVRQALDSGASPQREPSPPALQGSASRARVGT